MNHAKALTKLKDSLDTLYKERLRGLYVYGSVARGEARPDSDVDIAMILDDFERPWPEIQRTGEIVSALSLEYDLTFSLIPVTWQDWSANAKPLVRNIHREGVAL